MDYQVGVAQFQPVLHNVCANRDKMLTMASTSNVDLLVFPELATSGYMFASSEQLANCAEASTGETCTAFALLAAKKNTSYVIGFPEKTKQGVFNSAMLINPDKSVYIYRKTHLFYEEKLWFLPGDSGFNVFPAKENVMLGMMICFDWIFPESARSLALAGANIIVHPANLVLPWCQKAMLTRSLENRVFSMTANRTGTDIINNQSLTFTGASQIVSPAGEVLTSLNETEDGIKTICIDPAESNNKNINSYNHIFGDRRKEMYRDG